MDAQADQSALALIAITMAATGVGLAAGFGWGLATAGAEFMVAHNKKGPFVSVDYLDNDCAKAEATDPYVVVIGNGVKDVK